MTEIFPDKVWVGNLEIPRGTETTLSQFVIFSVVGLLRRLSHCRYATGCIIPRLIFDNRVVLS